MILKHDRGRGGGSGSGNGRICRNQSSQFRSVHRGEMLEPTLHNQLIMKWKTTSTVQIMNIEERWKTDKCIGGFF